MSPQGIQLSREKGYRKPVGAVVVARPGKWGNPWRVGSIVHHRCGDRVWTTRMTAAEAVSFFEVDLRAGLLQYTVADVRRELVGRDLACWCAVGAACHRDVLLSIAAGGA